MYSIRGITKVKKDDCWFATIDYLPSGADGLTHTDVIEVRGLSKKLTKQRAKTIVKALNTSAD
jgi:hypothetical protein